MHSPSLCYCLYCHHIICDDPWILPPSSPLHASMLFLNAVFIVSTRNTSPAPCFCASHLNTCPQLHHHVCWNTHPFACSCCVSACLLNCASMLHTPRSCTCSVLHCLLGAHPANYLLMHCCNALCPPGFSPVPHFFHNELCGSVPIGVCCLSMWHQT